MAVLPQANSYTLILEDELCQNDLGQMSRDCGYSPNHMRIVFQETYGLSPFAYRNLHRMNRALLLIKQTKKALKEISSDTGFPHPSHFSRMFRSTYGESPNEALCRLRKRDQ